MPAVGLAQSRVGVTVNAGTQATSTAFTTRSTLTLHREDGDLRVDYGVDAGAFIDLGASVRLWRQVGLGVGVSRFQTTGGAGVTAGLPHPFHLEQFRAVDGSAAATRQETAVHVQLRVGATVGPRLEVTLFGGPTFFDVEQTLVSDILFKETYPYDTATFSSAPTVLRSVTAVGFHTGVDLAWQSEDTNEERCRRNPLEARTSSPRHVSAGWGDGIRTWTMVRRTQSRGLGGSRVYKWPSGAGKTEIPARYWSPHPSVRSDRHALPRWDVRTPPSVTASSSPW